MYDRVRVKAIAKKKVHLNFVGLVSIPFLLWLSNNFVIPAISGFSFVRMFEYYYFFEDISYIFDFLFSPFQILLGIILSIFVPMFLDYWRINYEMSVHINDDRKFYPWDILEELSLEGLFTYVIKNTVAGIITFLWSLLLLVPGIMKAYSYALVPYIAIENPELGIMETLKESQRLMQGNRITLFVLHISFFLWYILANLTFGILYVYITPYVSLSAIGFYYAMKKQHNDDLNIYNAQEPYFDEEL